MSLRGMHVPSRRTSLDIALSRLTSEPWSQSPGQSADLDLVFTRYLDPVYRFLYSRVGNREDAEDLTSEVFLKATRLLDRERPEASIAQWLFTVARTVLADHWRRYYRNGSTLPLDESHMNDLPEDEPVQAAPDRHDTLVAEILGALPQRYRQVLELRFLKGYSIQETASEMAISPENVKVIQHRALARALALQRGQP